MAIVKRQKVIHKRYYVYRIDVDDYFYYGITCNIEERKRQHFKKVAFLMVKGRHLLDPLNTKCQVVHHAIAGAFLSKRFFELELRHISMNICFHSKSLSKVKEVEAFLIKNSINIKGCCNSKNGN